MNISYAIAVSYHYRNYSRLLYVRTLQQRCAKRLYNGAVSTTEKMGDADILAKLSRILETHHLSGDHEEENASIEEILHNISVEAGIRLEDFQNEMNSPKFVHPPFFSF